MVATAEKSASALGLRPKDNKTMVVLCDGDSSELIGEFGLRCNKKKTVVLRGYGWGGGRRVNICSASA